MLFFWDIPSMPSLSWRLTQSVGSDHFLRRPQQPPDLKFLQTAFHIHFPSFGRLLRRHSGERHFNLFWAYDFLGGPRKIHQHMLKTLHFLVQDEESKHVGENRSRLTKASGGWDKAGKVQRAKH